MIIGWFKKRRRRKILAQPFPEEWYGYLEKNVNLYIQLTESEQGKLRDILRVVISEKYWEACQGFQMNDEVKVTIAALAALLLIGMKDEYIENVQSVLVYPEAYLAKVTSWESGLVLEHSSPREGEAWYRGPVILSWEDVLLGGRHEGDGRNLVLHEFAHKLDMQNGLAANGVPILKNKDQYDRWQAVMNSEYNQLVHDCQNGQYTILDCYGATDIAEFFAVATECFFELPQEMKRHHPALYEILSEYYCQDPARRN